MKRRAASCVLLASAVALSACAGSHRVNDAVQMRPGAQVSAGKISSSALILGGRVRCTATVTTPVQAGQDVGLTLSLRNVSGSTARAGTTEGSSWLVVRPADDARYDTRQALAAEESHGGPYRMPLAIRPGETKTMRGPSVFVRWKGPLRITPGCEQKALPALDVKVTAPGPPRDDSTAIADVVAATGHLLDHCRPEQSGVAVVGQIDPPGGSGPPMAARCSVTLHSEGRFVVAQVLVLIPPRLHGVRVLQPYDTLSLGKRPRPYEAIAWQLVVTSSGAVTVAGFNRDATRAANRMAPEWTWSWADSSWEGPGSARCGYVGIAGGPSLDLISACP